MEGQRGFSVKGKSVIIDIIFQCERKTDNRYEISEGAGNRYEIPEE